MAREYYFLRALSSDASVDYAYFGEPIGQPAGKGELPDGGKNCHVVLAVPKPRTYTTRQKVLGALGKWPLPIVNYMSGSMAVAVRRLLQSNRYDMIHVDSIHMVRYVQDVDTPCVYNWHNIESEAIRRFAYNVESKAKSWYAHTTADKMQRLERQILSREFGHVVCSERERIQLLAHEPRARIAVVENGVDTKRFTRMTSIPDDARNVVFVGKMDYYPNIEAVVWFATNIWPSVRNQMQGMQFTIVGANPTRVVVDLSRIPGIIVTGTVPDVRPYYENALAAIVPLRTGGGTRLKILEAMAAGVPVVSTPLGAEGLEVTPDHDILIADPDDGASWVRHLNELSERRARRSSLTAAALDLVRARYDWEILGQKLRLTYQGWLNAMI